MVDRMTTTQAVTATTKKAPSTQPVQPVRLYLKALKASRRDHAGRPKTMEAVQRRLAAAEASLAGARERHDVINELRFAQKIIDIKAELRGFRSAAANDPAKFEDGFVKNAAKYSKSAGITRGAWRRIGVPSNILDKAGL
jgi:hypothetical protein